MSRSQKWTAAIAVTAVALAVTAAIVFTVSAVGGHLPPSSRKEPRMPTSNVLVLYYSRTGATAKLADAIIAATGADAERIEDTVDRRGFFGFVRSLRDAARKRPSAYQPLASEPELYDLVVVGTPDWGRSMAAPVRAFLADHRGKLPRVAFFLTDGESDHALVFADMAALAESVPVATLGIAHDRAMKGDFESEVAGFVAALRRPAGPRPEPEPVQPAF